MVIAWKTQIRRINALALIRLISEVIAVCLLKSVYVPSLAQTDGEKYMHDILAADGLRPAALIIWALPFVISAAEFGNLLFHRLTNFDMRYGNRHVYLRQVMYGWLMSVIIYHLLTGWVQIQLLYRGGLVPVAGKMVILAGYAVELSLFDLATVGTAIYAGKYIYALMFWIAILILLNFIPHFPWMPFIGYFESITVNLFSVFLSILLICWICMLYLRFDLIGENK